MNPTPNVLYVNFSLSKKANSHLVSANQSDTPTEVRADHNNIPGYNPDKCYELLTSNSAGEDLLNKNIFSKPSEDVIPLRYLFKNNCAISNCILDNSSWDNTTLRGLFKLYDDKDHDQNDSYDDYSNVCANHGHYKVYFNDSCEENMKINSWSMQRVNKTHAANSANVEESIVNDLCKQEIVDHMCNGVNHGGVDVKMNKIA